MNGAARRDQSVGEGYPAAEAPKQVAEKSEEREDKSDESKKGSVPKKRSAGAA